MAKTIRLTESELKSMIAESVKNILNEIGDTDHGQELLGRAAGRAQKKARNIGRSNDFDGYCKSMSKADKIGNYARDARIKTTGKADDVNGAFTRGVKHSKQVLSEFNSVLPYGNNSSREPIDGTYELTASQLFLYAPNNEEVRELIEFELDGAIIDFSGIRYREEDTNYQEVQNITVDRERIDSYMLRIDSAENFSNEAKEYAKQALMNIINDIDENDIDWRD